MKTLQVTVFHMTCKQFIIWYKFIVTYFCIKWAVNFKYRQNIYNNNLYWTIFHIILLNLKDVSEKRVPIYICGNKMDLRADALEQGITCIKTEQGEQMARDNGAVLLETSSKSGFNVPSAIIGLCR